MAKQNRRAAPVQKNEIYEAAVVGMTQEGSGVCKIEGFSVFVPLCAVGDRVRIRIVKVLASYAYGRLEEVLQPAASRIENDCPVFRQCGGCVYRHLSYEAECAIKQQQVEDAFRRLGGVDQAPLPICGDRTAARYRNKAQYPFGINEAGEPVLGFYAAHSHRMIACDDCKLQPAIFTEIAAFVLAFVKKHRIPVYQESTGEGLLRHLYLRMAVVTGEVMVCLVGAKKRFGKGQELAQAVQQAFGQVASVVYNYNPRRDNVILGLDCTTLWGKDTIEDLLCGVRVDISPLSFYQVNHAQAEALYRKAMEFAALTKEDILLDLYCGIGTIGLSAADRVKQLIGVEVIPEAIEDAKKNAAKNSFGNTRFLCGDCKETVAVLEREGISPDVIIVDPPRKGCDREVLETIARFAPKRLVMVSCNPATAARDCKALGEWGFAVQCYQPFDLFPRTGHVETVCLLSRNK